MKRRLATAVLVLIGGIIVNIAVAWTATILADPYHVPWDEVTLSKPAYGRTYKTWRLQAFPHAGFVRIRSSWEDWDYLSINHSTFNGNLPSPNEILPAQLTRLVSPRPQQRSLVCPSFAQPMDGLEHFRILDAAGWPARALWTRCDYSLAIADDRYWLPPYVIRCGVELNALALNGPVVAPPTAPPNWKALPLGPLWPGFLFNTLVYSLAISTPMAIPYALRRRHHRRRGLCPKCAYPIGQSPCCTECGHTLNHAVA